MAPRSSASSAPLYFTYKSNFVVLSPTEQSNRPDSSFLSCKNKAEFEKWKELIHYESEIFYELSLPPAEPTKSTKSFLKSKGTGDVKFYVCNGYTREEETIFLFMKRKLRVLVKFLKMNKN